MGQHRAPILAATSIKPPIPSHGRFLGRGLVGSLIAYMTELGLILSRLDLHQYLDKFVSEGFDTWETLSEITEADLYGHSCLMRTFF